MKLWMQNGKWVTAGGKLVTCDSCPCPPAWSMCDPPIRFPRVLTVVFTLNYQQCDCGTHIPFGAITTVTWTTTATLDEGFSDEFAARWYIDGYEMTPLGFDAHVMVDCLGGDPDGVVTTNGTWLDFACASPTFLRIDGDITIPELTIDSQNPLLTADTETFYLTSGGRAPTASFFECADPGMGPNLCYKVLSTSSITVSGPAV